MRDWRGTCAQHPWPRSHRLGHALRHRGRTLFATVFSQNMTTVLKFTTGNDSQLAETSLPRDSPRPRTTGECLVSSNKYTADDPEFWAYVDGLYREADAPRRAAIVKDVQYYQPLVREALPLMAAHRSR